MRRTKIICTIGPSSCTAEAVERLVAAGMDVARLNFSHGEHADHRQAYELIRATAARQGRNVAIMMDLQGPKIRTGRLKDGRPVDLVEGNRICLTTRDLDGDALCVSTTYEHLPHDVKEGDRILVADGTMELRAETVEPPDVHCRVVRGGALGQHKGINLPDVAVSAPSLTEKDLEDLAFGLELGVDFVALSFVRTADDLQRLRERTEGLCARLERELPVLVAKIERPEALKHIDEIVPLADAVMVARGDLGVEVDLNDIPQIQKDLIRRCNARGIPVITATQMLESMMTNARPTRAEVTDVANAVYDGTDAVMLSGETAAGQYPIEAVLTMADIVEKADQAAQRVRPPMDSLEWKGSFNGAIADAVSRIVATHDVARIVCFTQSGYTARAIARHRPMTPITAITLSEATMRLCALVWGMEAIQTGVVSGLEEVIETVDSLLLGRGLAERGDNVVIVAGMPLAIRGVTNLLYLHTIGITN